jgi:hypothetical protein
MSFSGKAKVQNDRDFVLFIYIFRTSKIQMTNKNTYTNNSQDVRHTSKQQDAKLLPYILSCKKCETLHIKSIKLLPCKVPDFLYFCRLKMRKFASK